ncbi:hypothetical protein TNCV_1314731 [Trichonephila clavipes]|uniref:Uncharacterized protein n=1 Tax=Trichonephila clavipes TaxID=2585209 RepID=A0A8X6VIV0_TRICX|nr:hypothetical protein TNCV_1314731 [Trichonephila clavipes]
MKNSSSAVESLSVKVPQYLVTLELTVLVIPNGKNKEKEKSQHAPRSRFFLLRKLLRSFSLNGTTRDLDKVEWPSRLGWPYQENSLPTYFAHSVQCHTLATVRQSVGLEGVHPWYQSKYPGGSLVRGSSRGDQTALTRFLSGHLMSLIFVDGIKHFETCPKCSSVQGLPSPYFILFGAYQAGLGSRSPIGFGLLQDEWTHGPDLALLILGMRNNNNTNHRQTTG